MAISARLARRGATRLNRAYDEAIQIAANNGALERAVNHRDVGRIQRRSRASGMLVRHALPDAALRA